jgi:hypothetical protein
LKYFVYRRQNYTLKLIYTWSTDGSVGGFVGQNFIACNFVALGSVAAAEESFENWQRRLIVRASAVLEYINDGVFNFSVAIVSDLLEKLIKPKFANFHK